MHKYTHVLMHTDMDMYMYMYMYMIVYVYMYICICICICIYMYMYMHMHMPFLIVIVTCRCLDVDGPWWPHIASDSVWLFMNVYCTCVAHAAWPQAEQRRRGALSKATRWSKPLKLRVAAKNCMFEGRPCRRVQNLKMRFLNQIGQYQTSKWVGVLKLVLFPFHLHLRWQSASSTIHVVHSTISIRWQSAQVHGSDGTWHGSGPPTDTLEYGRLELDLQGWHQAFRLSIINCDSFIALWCIVCDFPVWLRPACLFVKISFPLTKETQEKNGKTDLSRGLLI
jgi:hypothetical protein